MCTYLNIKIITVIMRIVMGNKNTEFIIEKQPLMILLTCTS